METVVGMREPTAPQEARAPCDPPASAASGAALGFKQDLAASWPELKKRARALCRDAALADDLAQETCLSALLHAHQYRAGSNMRAWLFAILRNQYYSFWRKRRREVEDIDHHIADRVCVPPAQDWAADLADVANAIAALPAPQRDILLLAGVSGCSYLEMAERSGACEVGTVKSRLHRARERLAKQLN